MVASKQAAKNSNAGPTTAPKHRRKSHAKTKSGCLTCKIRRKKCDETRPFCQRCLSTGRKCDGYAHFKIREHEDTPFDSQDWSWEASAQHPAWVATVRSNKTDLCARASLNQRGRSCPPHQTVQHSLASLAKYPLYIMNPPLFHLDSELEYICFDYFRLKTGPGFAAYYHSSWPAVIIEACFTEPVVLRAVAAIGAVSYRYQLGITPDAFKFCAIADRLFRTALQNWTAEVARGEYVNRPEIMMVLGKLFATFETFQDNPNNATTYMTYAFHQVLNSRLTLLSKNEQFIDLVLNRQTLRQYFFKLERQAAHLFGRSADLTWDSLEDYVPDFPMPPVFTSIEQGRDYLFAEVRQIWGISQTSVQAAECDVHSERRKHLSRLMSWSKAHAGYAQIHCPTDDPLLKRISRLLKLYREAAFLHLLILPSETSGSISEPAGNPGIEERQHTSLIAHFARLVILSDSVPDANLPFATSALHYPSSGDERSPASPSMSWTPSLFRDSMDSSLSSQLAPHMFSLAFTRPSTKGLMLGSAGCRSSEIRNRLMEYLNHSPSASSSPSLLHPTSQINTQDDVWSDPGVYTVAERYSSIEELAGEIVLKQYHQRSFLNPAYTDTDTEAKWVDITYFAEVRLVRLVYCKPDTSWKTKMKDGRVEQGPMRRRGGFVWVQEWYSI